jgi:hypothetical protein
MQIIPVLTTLKSPKFTTLQQAEVILDKVTPDTKIISLSGVREVMSSPLHHLIVCLCIREGYGWEFVSKLRFIEPFDSVIKDKVDSALEYAKSIWGEPKPSPDELV